MSGEEGLKSCNLSVAFSVLYAKKEGLTMDERTKLLICLGAATAANCIPCFEHYFGKAESTGLAPGEIQEAVDLASQVKKGAHLAIRNCINGLLSEEKKYALPCDRQVDKSCCG
jgi:alkylhydroperoxidase/carboxymuconolactone decarboxylase family protein YurZ